MRCSTENPIAFCVDVLIFLAAVTLLVLVECAHFSPFKTFGFHCNDPKLQFKNEGETVSASVLLFVSFVVPCLVFHIVEWTQRNGETSSLKPSWARKGHMWYLRYLHGLCFTVLVVDVVKIIAGEPRPHFLDTCKPFEADNCTTGQYFAHFTCRNVGLKPYKVYDSYKSFPSGHAAFSFYAASFLAIYLNAKVKSKSLFLLNFLHLSCLIWALLCSISRITDHRHHWWDVLCGGILGVTICWYFYIYRYERKGTEKLEAQKLKPFQPKMMNNLN